jgi:Zn-dependent peptidase ImmA (M78 family)
MKLSKTHAMFVRQMLSFEVDRCKEALAKKLYISRAVIEYRLATCIQLINSINKKYGIKEIEVSDFEKHERVEVEYADFTEVKAAKVRPGRNKLGHAGHKSGGQSE